LNFTISNPGLKTVSSNASSAGWMVGFLGGNDRGFLKEGAKIFLMASMSRLACQLFLGVHICNLWEKLKGRRTRLGERRDTRIHGPASCRVCGIITVTRRMLRQAWTYTSWDAVPQRMT
jgi:hypothetical protein